MTATSLPIRKGGRCMVASMHVTYVTKFSRRAALYYVTNMNIQVHLKRPKVWRPEKDRVVFRQNYNQYLKMSPYVKSVLFV